ncbi:hypothetical protein [Nioella ostreopsis]|uniref:hypothetical protein n=1 Tax=Nioella ostreopsis TaxID=2448479 RepID=UPI000FDA76EF|nr:hypothetical protein [Nioella ostreopsis]
MRTDEIRDDVQTLFRGWEMASGISGFCGELLRGLHRGEGMVDVRSIPLLDAEYFNAAVGLMIAARIGLPMSGIRSFLTDQQFASLFDQEPGSDAGISM